MIKRGLALLTQKPDFAYLMGAQFLAQAGDGIVQGALAKLIVFGGQKGFDLEGARSPDELMRIALYLLLPYTVLSPFLGVVIDRWDRRRLLAIANGFRAFVLLIIGLVSTDTVGDAVLFLAFLLTLMSTRLVLATKAAALPATLGEESLVEGNSVSQLGGALFQIGGVGVALVATNVIEVEPVVIGGALVYLAGAVCGWMIKRAGEPRPRGTLGEEIARVVRNIVAGIQEVARTPKAGASITTYFWLRLLWSFAIVAIAFVLRDLLADDDLTLAILTGGAGAVGAALGFIMARRLHDRVESTARVVVGASIVPGLAVAILGAGLQLDPAIAKASASALSFFLGFGFFLAKISLDTMVQEALGDDFRGRAFSLYDIAYNLAWVLAAGVMVLFWTEDSQGILTAVMGAIFLVGVFFIAGWFRRAGLLGRARVEVASP